MAREYASSLHINIMGTGQKQAFYRFNMICTRTTRLVICDDLESSLHSAIKNDRFGRFGSWEKSAFFFLPAQMLGSTVKTISGGPISVHPLTILAKIEWIDRSSVTLFWGHDWLWTLQAAYHRSLCNLSRDKGGVTLSEQTTNGYSTNGWYHMISCPIWRCWQILVKNGCKTSWTNTGSDHLWAWRKYPPKNHLAEWSRSFPWHDSLDLVHRCRMPCKSWSQLIDGMFNIYQYLLNASDCNT